MMRNFFTIWLAYSFFMMGFVCAHQGGEQVAELQKDRERLVNLVLALEDDFSATLTGYEKLQTEYAELLKRPPVEDQSGKVKDLRDELAKVTTRLRVAELQKVDLNAYAVMERDLISLRNELHRERQNLLVAKAQVLRVQQLEEKEAALELALKEESQKSAEVMSSLQEVRGERDVLLVKIKGLMVRAEQAERRGQEARLRIGVLEKETSELKSKLRTQEEELRELRVDRNRRDGIAAKAVALRKEQGRLVGLLAARESELNGLRADLAAEMKRSLEVPLLIKARDDLQDSLGQRDASVRGLKQKNERLAQKQAQLQKEIEEVQGGIKAMQGELSKNKVAMEQVAQLGDEKQALIAERDQLTQTITGAKGNLVKVQGLLKSTEAQLAESRKEVKKMKALNEQNHVLQAQVKKQKKQITSVQEDMAELKERVVEGQAAIKAAAELGQRVELMNEEKNRLDTQLRKAKLEREKAERKLEAVEADFVKKSEMALAELRKEVGKIKQLKSAYEALSASAVAMAEKKEELSIEVDKRDKKLRKLRVEIADLEKKPDVSGDLVKLQKERDQLRADLSRRETDLKKMRDELGRLQLSAAVANKQLGEIRRGTAKIEPVRYAKGEADVTAQQARVFTQVQRVLELFPSARFEIVGHTCDLGSAEGNLRLSQQRAEALQNFLIEQGVEEERLNARGVGLAEPVVPNTSESNRRKNRRVVVEILD